MHNQLQKAINLAKKTGDRLIVFDAQEPENVYVVMSLDEYEKMVVGHSGISGLTKDELLDKINRDIAIWQSERDWVENRPGNSKRKSAASPVPVGGILAEKAGKAKKGSWAIPVERKKAAEEIIIEEDRQYLEEV